MISPHFKNIKTLLLQSLIQSKHDILINESIIIELLSLSNGKKMLKKITNLEILQ
jgi:hypothetical protein